MFGDGSLTFREFTMREPLPLARIQEEIFEFLRGRDDAVMFGAQAVNAWVGQARMTEDVDIMSVRGPELAEELRSHLAERFTIAVRVRTVRDGLGYRIYQVRKPANRHLADVRPVDAFPPVRRIDGILVPVPEEVIAGKVRAHLHREGRPKGGTDQRDLVAMLLAFPGLKTESGPVRERLEAGGADEATLAAWGAWVSREILPENEDDEFGPG